jgi:hypothetical protein
MSNPVVTVKNHSTHDIFIDGDPNWDDQVLLIDGKPTKKIYTLTQGSDVEVSVHWNQAGAELMMGVIFADAAQYDSGDVGFYQLSIGQETTSGNLGVTDGDAEGQPLVRFTVTDQEPWSMTMDFVDA